MKHLKYLFVAIIAGITLAGVFSQFTTSKYPPCDLVAKGIGVSTFGCSNSENTTYACKDKEANSKEMESCIQQNYYRLKTFPFGFEQKFGPNSNLIDNTPLHKNRMASVALGFVVTLILVYTLPRIKKHYRHS